MNANTLHEVEEVMVDKVALAYHLALSIICQGNGVPYKLAMATVKFCGTVLGVAEKDVAAVDFAVRMISEDPEFLSKTQATEEQIIRAMWPNRKVS